MLDKTILASRSRRWQLHCSRELDCLKECNHPYVVGLAYSFQTPQYLYMVQEYLPNHTLASYLDAHEGQPVAIDELRFCLAQLTCGLAHIHTRGIVYRDLKPANVLVDDQGHMRIVDMGMASRLDPETGRRKSVCGTQRYMAPEMKAKEPYNCSVDWYSLGKLILDCQVSAAPPQPHRLPPPSSPPQAHRLPPLPAASNAERACLPPPRAAPPTPNASPANGLRQSSTA